MKSILAFVLCGKLYSSLASPVNAEQNISIPIDLSPLYNNRAFAARAGDASFNNGGEGYPAEYMPDANLVYHGVDYIFPTYKAAGNDNVLAQGQTIPIPRGKYFSVQVLTTAESGSAVGDFTATYSDGSKSTGRVLVQTWWSGSPTGGDFIFPYHFTKTGVNWGRPMIYEAVAPLNPSKEMVSLMLPNVTGGTANAPGGAATKNRLHLFSLSLTTAANDPKPDESAQLEVQYARSTQKWLPGSDKVQIVEVIINSIGGGWVKGSSYVEVSIQSAGYKTVNPGIIKRLRPGDQARIEVGVVNENMAVGSTGEATVVLSGPGIHVTHVFNTTYGIQDYVATYDSIYTHESPSWYSAAKYGIFIHWGPYSVPGWGNSGPKENYAEWYWYDLTKGPTNPVETYQYHLETYGPNVTYDDFIQNFTASNFNPKDWVDLFDDAGATYFVQVSKHHDGYAIFDLPANVSKRTSVSLFPYRNLLQELFDAAEKYQPQLRRGTYFSLPEWFHPDYKKYGFSLWPGGNATDPFSNKTLPYTGYVPVHDYVPDVILPSMNALADMGTDIMWCDIGGANLTAEFAAAWYNTAGRNNRQVTMNNRCGLPGDFDTPEYARYAAAAPRKWESNLGMDPFSYGYNRATPLANYLNASSIVTSLIDIVSKNGNFLLDIGPQADGTIIQVEQDHLRDAGKWIKSHSEAIFNTTYWYITAEEGDNTRFTITPDAFYIFSLKQPKSSIILSSPVPLIEGDKVTVVGGALNGSIVASRFLANGSIQIDVPDEVVQADQYAWVFKITY